MRSTIALWENSDVDGVMAAFRALMTPLRCLLSGAASLIFVCAGVAMVWAVKFNEHMGHS